MKAPDKIYYGVLDNGFQCVNTVQTSTTPDAYIRKEALLEWLDYLKGKVVGDEKRVLVLSIIDKLNSL